MGSTRPTFFHTSYDGLGKLIGEYSADGPPAEPMVHYTATDPLGSPRVLTNERGDIVSRRDFMPFGEEIVADQTYRKAADEYGVGDGVRQKFTGYEHDVETGLDFAEARYYYNNHGRFTAVDPLLASGKSANPQTFNRYAYTMNRPLILTDPTGLQAGRSARPRSSPPKTVRVTVTPPANPSIETYPVRGETSNEVWRNAAKSRERGFAGEYEGTTSWSARFTQTSTARVRGGYSVTVQTTEINITIKKPTITLPTWENKSDASPAEQQKWEESLATLKRHEYDHHDIEVDGLNNIVKPALESISSPVTGTGQGRTVDKAREAAIRNAVEKIKPVFDDAKEKVEERQKQFDSCTDHGRRPCQQ